MGFEIRTDTIQTCQWTIPDFFSPDSERRDVCYYSPDFDFAGARWRLRLRANRARCRGWKKGSVNVLLKRVDDERPPRIVHAKYDIDGLGRSICLQDRFKECLENWGCFVTRGYEHGCSASLYRTEFRCWKSYWKSNRGEELSIKCELRDIPKVVSGLGGTAIWRIPDFFSRSYEKNVRIRGPVFTVVGAQWYVRLFPVIALCKGLITYHMTFQLVRKDDGPRKSVKWRIHISGLGTTDFRRFSSSARQCNSESSFHLSKSKFADWISNRERNEELIVMCEVRPVEGTQKGVKGKSSKAKNKPSDKPGDKPSNEPSGKPSDKPSNEPSDKPSKASDKKSYISKIVKFFTRICSS